jgi:hypothetical protein
MQMTEEQLKEQLQEPYNLETWEKTLRFVFSNVSIYTTPQDIPHENEKVKVFRQIGTVQLHDGKDLALFELELKENVNLLRNRVELNKLVSQYIDEDKAHGVLSIYEQGEEDYRFTFTAKGSEYDEELGDMVTKATDTKRFTYVLGKNESCRTAAHRFYELAHKKETAELEDVQEAFSVEKLSKQFFKEYKDHYDHFVNYLVDTPSYFTPIFKRNDKSVRDFVKLLLGRIVFIQFLQKKRWMGVPADDKGWNYGEVNFLHQSFNDFDEKDVFYSLFLEPLYYEALNKPNRPNDIFPPTGTKVPYLNGGLFEKHKEDTSLLNFPSAYFEDLFDFFDKYNFTIDENDPEEHEVGIDPEMLGHIFENLLEDNKDKGAFYTPKEIVHYMCQESLKEYLKTYLQEQGVWPQEETQATELENSLSRFVQYKEGGGVIDHDAALSTALKNVKVCDPAIGSGAFPMGLLNEIFKCVSTLHDASPDKVEKVWEMESWEPHIVKRNIIQNSIYGVDIEKGAVDIARLRFWLSLITDEPEPTSLPNLDYKIVAGNSLVSKFEGEVIAIDWDKKNSTMTNEVYLQELQDSLLKISEKQKKYFDPKVKNKEKLSIEIRNLKLKVLKNQLSLDKEGYMNKTAEKGGFAPTAKDTKHNAERQSQILAFDATLKKIENLLKDFTKDFKHFDWKLDFPEVMNGAVNEKPGFDIVIGNPPYVSAPAMVKSNPELRKAITSTNRYSSLYQKWDLYIPFMELGLQLLTSKSVFAMIVPFPLTNQNYGLKLRELILTEHNLIEIVNLNGTKIFDNATVSNCIPIISKSKPENECYISGLNVRGKINRMFIQQFSDLVQDKKTQIWNLTTEKRQASQHIDLNVLGDFCYVSKGMVLNSNEKTAKGEFSKGDLISETYDEIYCRKYIEAKDIERYKVKRVRYLEYNTERCPSQLSRPTFRELYDIPKLMFNRLGSLKVYLDEKTKFLHSDSMYSAVLWKDLDGVKNKSISASVKRYSNLLRKEMVDFSGAVDLKYLIALLNSKYVTTLLEKARGGDYHIYPEHIRNLPIPKITIKKQRPFIGLANDILKNKAQGIDTKTLEQQIDNLVYRLYDLSYNDVKVIDLDFYLTEKEYKGIEM